MPAPYAFQPLHGGFANDSPASSASEHSLLRVPAGQGDHSQMTPTVSEKFALSAAPVDWGAMTDRPEPDDRLHNPDPRRDRNNDSAGTIFTWRGLMNIGFLALLAAALLMLFAGYPLYTAYGKKGQNTSGGFNLGFINASGQVADFPNGQFGLIDPDTPAEAFTRMGYNGEEFELVFSDEFNVNGRTFYPGDDPYWEAVDMHYWGTNNLEWYSPRQITTSEGNLEITLDDTPSHNLEYEGGMMATWNKFCFTGGYLTANISLPGASDVWGLWPAFWSMGNLGRAGYGASLDGMWPYTYDSCDVGTLRNQSLNNYPPAATTTGDPSYDNSLSYLEGQKLSRCTCEGEDHPGPKHPDGTFVGRAAPEIDVLEAQVEEATRTGHVSMSGQWAPFNANYFWTNTTDNYFMADMEHNELNTYKGGVFQQSTSGVIMTNQECYQNSGGCFEEYGFEYAPGNDGFITWSINQRAVWGLTAAGVGPDPESMISQRPVPYEPMYILLNQGISKNFGNIAFDQLHFPTIMKVDWVRVYQPKGKRNIGCDPPEYPTADYINKHEEAYKNPNLTTWKQFNMEYPKNALMNQDDPACQTALKVAPPELLQL